MAKRTESETKALAREAIAESRDPGQTLRLKLEGEVAALRRAVTEAIAALEDGRRGDALRELRRVTTTTRTPASHSSGDAA